MQLRTVTISLAIFLSLLISQNLLSATDATVTEDETIHFFVKNQNTVNNTSATKLLDVEQSVVSMKKFIKTIRSTICPSAGNADVKVWLTVNADGKIFGIGMSGESGLEIVFHCK